MAALTWRNVDTPNLSPALAGYAQFSQLLGNAFTGATNALNTFDDSKTEANSNQFMQSLLTKYAENPDKLNADLQSGAVFEGTDRKRLSTDALNLLARRPEDLLRYATGEIQRQDAVGDLAWQGKERGWTETDRNNLDAAKPQMQRLLQAASAKDPEAAMAAVTGSAEYQGAVGQLAPDMQMAIAKGGIGQVQSLLDLTTTRNQHLAQGDARVAAADNHNTAVFDLKQNQWTFGNAVVDRAEGRAGMTIGQSAVSGSQNGEQALINLENNADFQKLSGPAKAVARAQVAGAFGNVYAPTITTSDGGSISGEAIGNLPVVGKITSNFGNRTAPTAGASTNHLGIDIAAPAGTPINAPQGGRVIMAGPNGGYGNMVKIDHGNGVISEYGHMSTIGVKVGDTVPAGAKLGGVGSTGTSTGNHTHYGIKVRGQNVDPRSYRWTSSPQIEAASSASQLNTDVGTGTWAANLGNESNAQEVAGSLRGTEKERGPMWGVPAPFIATEVNKIVNDSRVNGVPTLNYAQAGRVLADSQTGGHRSRVGRILSGDAGDVNLGNGYSLDRDAISRRVNDAKHGRFQDTASAVETVNNKAAAIQNAREQVQRAEAEYDNMIHSGRPEVIRQNAARLQAKVVAARNAYAMVQAANVPSVQSNRQEDKPSAPWYEGLFTVRRER